MVKRRREKRMKRKSEEHLTFQEGNDATKNRRTHVPWCSRVNETFRVWFVVFFLVFVAAGCVGMRGAGICEPLSSQEKKSVLQQLKENWQDYDVYCDGPIDKPGALIFDPKNDDRNLLGFQYFKLSKEAGVRTAIVWIEFQIQYNPMLYRVFDEEKNFYGYVLIAYHLPTAMRLDTNTLQLPRFESMLYTGGIMGTY